VEVPNVVDESQADAESMLEDADLDAVIVENPSASVPEGDVVLQLPTAGTLVAPGSEVAVVVSSGPPETDATVSVPNVVGKALADAEKELRDAGFSVESVSVTGTSEKPGDVFAQAPASGTSAPEGSTITIVYAE